MAMGGGGDKNLMSEINVTPLVDVMLVLLIIFMVTAPMMTQGMDVALPKVDAGAMRTEGERVVITMNTQGEIFLDEFKVPIEDLGLKVKRVMEVKGSQQVYLRADQGIPYGQVAKVMSEVRQAGINNLGLVTEPEPVSVPQPSGKDKKKNS
ncbi:MAG: protein TolR [Deltaproteobacteria bacterium]|nr:protein TolR [Deltaproteobacteria bacterium]